MKAAQQLLQESLIPISEVPAHAPTRRGRKLHNSTVYRWTTKGVRGHVLQSTMIGGVRYTSHEALQRFFSNSTSPEITGAGSSHLAAANVALRCAGF